LKYSCIFLLLLLLFCAVPFNIAQSPDATISGIVVDPSGKVIPDADIEIANDTTGMHYSSKTNGAGIYTISILPPGQYRVQVSKIGFKTLIKPGIALNVQSAVAINFTLPVGAASESVTVEAGSSMINTTDASVSTVIDRKFVENMPLNGRSFQDLISMTPGVVTQSPQNSLAVVGSVGDFSVNGQRTESNYYMVDGVSANTSGGNGYGTPQPAISGSLGGTTALGTTQSLTSVDALQEFRVQSSTYSAEYGHGPGGQFSFVTRSGTNQFHGSAFEYLRNNFFDANDWFNDFFGRPISALRQNDFGGTIGGPVLLPHIYDGRRKTFFFASYEGLRLALPQAAAIQYVPDAYMRQQAPIALRAILSAFPLQNGIDYGTSSSPSLAQFIMPYSLPSRIDSTNVRIDEALGKRNQIFFKFNDTPSFAKSRSLSAATTSNFSAQSYTLGEDAQYSDKAANSFRLGYSDGQSSNLTTLDSFGGATPTDLAQALGTPSVSAATAANFELFFPGIGLSSISTSNPSGQNKSWNVNDSFSLTSGHHLVKLGVDFRRIESATTPRSPQAIVEYTTGQSVINNVAGSAFVVKSLPSTPVFKDTALFVQDEWKVTHRLSVSLGLRWEVNPAPTEAHGNNAYTLLGDISTPASLALAPQGTPLWKTTWYNLAPRLGVAWTAHEQPGRETIVRAGGGVFFDSDDRLAAYGYSGVGFEGFTIASGAALPLSPAMFTFEPSASAPYTGTSVYAFPEHLQLPYSLQWNVAVQQALGASQALTMTYVGANGRRLIQLQQLSLTSLNHNFGTVFDLAGGITSSYNALQVQFQRSVRHGVQALASYTWSHSLDYGSSDAAIPAKRGNSDFDVRNNLSGGLSWDLPSASQSKLVGAALNEWSLDGRLVARDAFPITLQGNLVTNPSNGDQYYNGLNLVSGVPTYLFGPTYPGGKVLNKAAFTVPAATSAGSAPRNFVRGFGETQINLAARKQFHLGDKISMQFRAEAFNLLNHPNFGYVDPTYTDATFGQATKMLSSSLGTTASQYQQGGPRSMQFALKLLF
jgi:hypothetical protein